jgi:hypothetical protein
VGSGRQAPSLDGISDYNNNPYLLKDMSTELLSPELDLELQEEVENDDQMTKDMEQEMECPRCYDMMTLSSDYDRLMYICQECDLSLVMK